MGDVVNLNKYRKSRDKSAETVAARENRARHGLAKSAKITLRRVLDRRDAELDGKKLE